MVKTNAIVGDYDNNHNDHDHGDKKNKENHKNKTLTRNYLL